MMLEDFFTLSEMKDGLSSTSRVEELISILQRQKDNARNNFADATRQWSAVARVLVATADNHSLGHFLELDGLVYINQWLKDAITYDSATNHDNVQEFIILLLRALHKLPVIIERLSEIGVCDTVNEVLFVLNTDAHDMAKTLLAQWKLSDNGVDIRSGPPGVMADTSMIDESTCPIYPSLDASSSELAGGTGVTGYAQRNSPQSNIETWTVVSEVDLIKDASISSSHDQSPNASTSMGNFNASGDVNSLFSSVSNSCQETFPVAEKSSVDPSAALPMDSNVTGSFTDSIPLEGATISQEPNEAEVMSVGSPHKLTISSPVHSPGKLEPYEEGKQDADGVISDATIIPKPVLVSYTACDGSVKKSVKVVEEPVSYGEEVFRDESICESLHESSSSESSGEQSNDTCKDEIDVSYTGDWKEIDCIGPSHLPKPTKDNAAKMEMTSEVKFDFGDDALEFAVLVAIEAEHEVADRERCSLSPKGRSDVNKTDFVSSMSGDKSTVDKEAEALSGDEPSPVKCISNILDDSIYVGVSKQTMESAPTSINQEPVKFIERMESNFDLNEVPCEFGDDMCISYFSGKISAPIAVVASSKGPPILPLAPLCFEGELGWKGSAATSAFRPASPRRTPDSENALSVHKWKPAVLNIDLNIVEEEDEIKTNAILYERSSLPSVVLSANSSIEISSIKMEKVKLDLNEVGDDDCPSSQSSSHRLSSSTASKRTASNIDLNGHPNSFDASPSASNQHSTDLTNHKRQKMDDPSISAMGFTLKESNSQSIHSSLVHISSVGHPVPPRTPWFLSHTGLPSHGYGGNAMPPNQFIPSSFYGPGSVPYMIDSRGAIVVPQFARPAEPNGSYLNRPTFPGNVASAPFPTSFSMGPMPSSIWDSNSGISSQSSGNRDARRNGQMPRPGEEHGILSQEQIRASYPSTFSSGMIMKHKESEQAWDFHNVGYEHVTSWR